MDSREIHLVDRPKGLPEPDDFRLVEVRVPSPEGDQVLVRNRYFALAAVMRTLMAGVDVGRPMGAYRPGEVMFGSALGEVVQAGPDADLRPGDLVAHPLGWREYALDRQAAFRRLDPDVLPDPALHLGQGLTAYAGLVGVARVRPGDTVFVSGAAGGVGSLAGQIARLKGAGRVVGSAGTKAKVELLTHELGYDAAFDYHDGPVVDRLREVAPDGIDVCFDNVGGEQLQAAIELARPGARFALCGMLAQQLGGGSVPVAVDPFTMIGKGLTLSGFRVSDHRELQGRWLADFGAWLREGVIKVPRVTVRGLAAAPRALIGLLRGDHAGMVLVEL
jgi:NADPH-dependent curcumin reductase CurA